MLIQSLHKHTSSQTCSPPPSSAEEEEAKEKETNAEEFERECVDKFLSFESSCRCQGVRKCSFGGLQAVTVANWGSDDWLQEHIWKNDAKNVMNDGS